MVVAVFLASCVAPHTFEQQSQSYLFNSPTSIPEVKLNFSLPNDWGSNGVQFSSVGVGETPTPASDKGIKKISGTD